MFLTHADWNTKIQASDLVVEQAACDCGVKCLLVQRAVWPKARPVGQMWKRWDLAARLAMKALVWTMRDSLMFSDPKETPSTSLPWTKGTSKLYWSARIIFLSIAPTKPRSDARQFVLYLENQEIGTETDKALALCQGDSAASAKLGWKLE